MLSVQFAFVKFYQPAPFVVKRAWYWQSLDHSLHSLPELFWTCRPEPRDHRGPIKIQIEERSQDHSCLHDDVFAKGIYSRKWALRTMLMPIVYPKIHFAKWWKNFIILTCTLCCNNRCNSVCRRHIVVELVISLSEIKRVFIYKVRLYNYIELAIVVTSLIYIFHKLNL